MGKETELAALFTHASQQRMGPTHKEDSHMMGDIVRARRAAIRAGARDTIRGGASSTAHHHARRIQLHGSSAWV